MSHFRPRLVQRKIIYKVSEKENELIFPLYVVMDAAASPITAATAVICAASTPKHVTHFEEFLSTKNGAVIVSKSNRRGL